MADTNLSNLTPADVGWLPEDLTGLKEENWQANEKHYITSLNISANRIIITPYYGAFYYDNYPLSPTTPGSSSEPIKQLTVRLVKDGVGTDLIRDSDYQVRGLDIGRTQSSSSKYGVYTYILLTKNIVNDFLNPNYNFSNMYIEISYHAFGGSVNYRNVVSRFLELQDAYSQISTAYTSLLNRVTLLEQQNESLALRVANLEARLTT